MASPTPASHARTVLNTCSMDLYLVNHARRSFKRGIAELSRGEKTLVDLSKKCGSIAQRLKSIALKVDGSTSLKKDYSLIRRSLDEQQKKIQKLLVAISSSSSKGCLAHPQFGRVVFFGKDGRPVPLPVRIQSMKAVFEGGVMHPKHKPGEHNSNPLLRTPLCRRDEFLNFCRQNRPKLYQDIFVKGKVLFQGVNICDTRYDIIKPILQSYKGYFSLLDLGAAQGYFSFRVGTEFPKAQCVMVEHTNDKEKHYSHHQDMLYQLCHLNSHLKNISYLHKEISFPTLDYLNKEEHFDVVLAMLVIHQVDRSMDVRGKLLQNLLKLGDHVILEVSNDVAPELWDYVRDELSKSETHHCKFLGEVERYYDPKTAYDGKFPNGKGEFYLFTRKHKTRESYAHKHPQRIKRSTFKAMNGVYTSSKNISR